MTILNAIKKQKTKIALTAAVLLSSAGAHASVLPTDFATITANINTDILAVGAVVILAAATVMSVKWVVRAFN